MFTKEELDLIDASLTEYYNTHNKAYEEQKAKGRKKCSWHLPVMDRILELQSKIFILKNSM